MAVRVVSGSVFRGEGTKIGRQRKIVRGVPTATGIWVNSGWGLALGAVVYILEKTATVLFLIGVEVLNYFFKGISLRRMIVEFSTHDQDSLKKISALFSSRNFIISSYEMEDRTDGSGNPIHYVTMVVKAKNMNEEGVLLMLLHDFPEITVQRIIYMKKSGNSGLFSLLIV